MQDELKIEPEQFPDVERQGWDAEEISEESANKLSNDIVRQMRRGDESKGNSDDRDIVGGVESADTPRGREETKN